MYGNQLTLLHSSVYQLEILIPLSNTKSEIHLIKERKNIQKLETPKTQNPYT